MYVDLGHRRGWVRFTWKELVVLASLVSTGAGFLLQLELGLHDAKQELAECKASIKSLREVQSVAPINSTRTGRVHQQPPDGD